MKEKIRRRTLFLVCVTALLLLAATLPTAALTPTWNVSAAYEGSVFYRNLTALPLTGNGADDMVRVALTQLGYHEGNSTADFAGTNQNGNRDFVEYNRLHGTVDNNQGNGNSYGYYWCASFVSWCARQAGVATSVIPKSISCYQLKNAFSEQGTYRSAASYTPKTGDLIFFLRKNDSVVSHVGIVRYAADGNVYTIEGNSAGGHSVALRTYSLSDGDINGYATPNYGKSSQISFKTSSSSPTGTYVTTAADGLNMRAAPGSDQAYVGVLPYASEVTVTEIQLRGTTPWGKTEADGKSGWICLAYAHLLTPSPSRLSLRTGEGRFADGSTERIYSSGEGEITLEKEVPVREGYSFLGWGIEPEGGVYCLPGGKITLEGDRTLYAVWKQSSFTVDFIDWDGSLISRQTLSFGQTPTPPQPRRLPDGENTYTFTGWSQSVSEVSGDAVYQALYEAKPIANPTEEENEPRDPTVTPTEELSPIDREPITDNGENEELTERVAAIVLVAVLIILCFTMPILLWRSGRKNR